MLKNFLLKEYLLFCFLPVFLVFSRFFAEAIILIFVIFFFINFKYHQHIISKESKLKNLFIFFLIIWFYLIFISLLNFDEVFYKKIIFYFRFFIISYFFYYFLDNKNKIKIFYLVVILLLFLIQIDLIIQFIFKKNLLGYIPSNNVRHSGLFRDELIAGGFLAKLSGLYFVSCFYFLEKKKISIIFFLLLVVIYLFSVFITSERMALILTLFAIFLLFLFLKKIRLILFSSILFFLIISGYIIYKNENFYNRHIKQNFIQLGIKNDYSKDSFFDSHYGAIWQTAYYIGKDNWVFGSGVKSYRKECSNSKYDTIASKKYKIRCSTHPHNYWLEIFSETGLVGLLLYISFFSYLLFISLKKYILSKTSYFIMGPVISLIILIWPIKTSGAFFNNFNSIIFWMIVGLLFVNYDVLDKKK
jgi:O-antigen ligase